MHCASSLEEPALRESVRLLRLVRCVLGKLCCCFSHTNPIVWYDSKSNSICLSAERWRFCFVWRIRKILLCVVCVLFWQISAVIGSDVRLLIVNAENNVLVRFKCADWRYLYSVEYNKCVKNYGNWRIGF